MKKKKPIVVAITGTPGTGKSEIAAIVARGMNANVISISELVKRKKITRIYDSKRKTWVVDAKDVRKSVNKELKEGLNIVEGHLAHEAIVDKIIILRCRPDVLKERLEGRGWPASKVKENVDAEMVDVVLTDVMERVSDKRLRERIAVYEIDTTHKKPEEIAGIIRNILKSSSYGKDYLPGKISWLKEEEVVNK